MNVFAILLLAAAIAFGLGKLFRLPPIPLLMLSGVGIRLIADKIGFELPESLIRQMIELGLAALVFTAGTDLSPRRIRGRSQAIAIVAVIQFLSLGAAGIATALLLDYSLTTALYLGCALSASSTLVAVRHLQSRRQMFEPFGRLVLGVLLLQDLFIILVMVVLIKYPDGPWAISWGLFKATGLASLAYAIHRWAIPFITRTVQMDDEELMLGSLSILFIFSGLAYILELPFLLGAFFAGFALSAFPMNGLVRGMLGSLSGFFLALFFISVGVILTSPSLLSIWHSVIFISVLIIVTVTLVTFVAEIVGYSTRAGVESGLLLSQTSEFSLLLALTGVASGQISAELFSMIALITVSTMTLTPFISRESVTWTFMKLHPRYRKGETDCAEMSGHAVLLGYGRGGSTTIKALKEQGIDIIVIDEDAAVIRKLIGQKITCIQGDGSDLRTLQRANCKNANVVICSMKRTRDAQTALEFLRGSRPKVIVRTFETEETELVRAAGGYPVETSQASASIFIKWMEANMKTHIKSEVP